MNLKKSEMETIILYNDADLYCEIYTCNRALMRKMDKLCIEQPEYFKVAKQDELSITYECPKKQIKVNKVRKLTEEERYKRKERALQNLTRQKNA
jgi:hypothetical protein